MKALTLLLAAFGLATGSPVNGCGIHESTPARLVVTTLASLDICLVLNCVHNRARSMGSNRIPHFRYGNLFNRAFSLLH